MKNATPTSAKQVLVINGHPDPESYIAALAAAYTEGLTETHVTHEVINLHELDFNLNLKYGYRLISELEPNLIKAMAQIKAADHIVWFFPMWWYGYPALMKGFVDRIFLPGQFFKYQKGKAFPDKLLKGKTGHIIMTADTVRWYDRWFMKSPALQQFKKGTLQFVGINPVKVTYIAPIKSSTPAFRAKWLQKITSMGRKAL